MLLNIGGVPGTKTIIRTIKSMISAPRISTVCGAVTEESGCSMVTRPAENVGAAEQRGPSPDSEVRAASQGGTMATAPSGAPQKELGKQGRGDGIW